MDTSAPFDLRNADDSHIGLQGYSPVSYLDDQQAELGDTAHHAEHEGIRYFFTSEEQRARFEANPQRYVPAFGGWCAFGMTVDARFRTNPNKFLVVDDRLLVFLGDIETDARALWQEGTDSELLAKATENWARFSAR